MQHLLLKGGSCVAWDCNSGLISIDALPICAALRNTCCELRSSVREMRDIIAYDDAVQRTCRKQIAPHPKIVNTTVCQKLLLFPTPSDVASEPSLPPSLYALLVKLESCVHSVPSRASVLNK